MRAEIATVLGIGIHRPVGVGRHIVLESLLEQGNGACLAAFERRVATRRYLAQHLLSHAPCLLGRHPAETANDDIPVERLSAALASAVVDEEGLDAGGLYPDAKPGQLIIPGNPGFVPGLHRLDGASGQGQLVQRDPFTGRYCHPPDDNAGTNTVNTKYNTINQSGDML